MNKVQKSILLACALTVLGFFVPYAWILYIPFQYLNTHIHEMSHALASLLTGGTPIQIIVEASGSGVTETRGGSGFVIASAGYLGSTVIGALIVGSSTSAMKSKSSLLYLMILLIASFLWVRGTIVGIAALVFWIGVLGYARSKFKPDSLIFFTQLIGAQQCLTAIQSIIILYQINSFSTQTNDAKAMEELTGIPGTVWAFSWGLISLILLGLALRRAWSAQTTSQPE